MSTDYQINEKDIETVLNILKKTDPNATPVAGFHEMSHTNPELLEEIKKELDKNKTSEN